MRIVALQTDEHGAIEQVIAGIDLALYDSRELARHADPDMPRRNSLAHLRIVRSQCEP